MGETTIEWKTSRTDDCDVHATDGAVGYWAATSGADLDDVAADFLSAYDLSNVEDAGAVTVDVTRIDANGDPAGDLRNNRVELTRRHDAKGAWVK